MKVLYSIIRLFLLKVAIAEPQTQHGQQQSTTSRIVVRKAFGTSVPLAQGGSTQPVNPQLGADNVLTATLATNSANFTDTNRAGFNPFSIGPQSRHLAQKLSVGTLNVFTIIVNPVAGFVLIGIIPIFTPNPLNTDQIYQAIYGRIDEQIHTAINNKDVSVLVSKLQTLSQNVNDETVAYINQLGITGNIQESLHGMAQGTVSIPFIESSHVDKSMGAIANILSQPNNWYTSPGNLKLSDSFALAGVLGLGKNYCLHLKDFKVSDGTHLVVDNQCNLNSMNDKLWALTSDDRLILRTNLGDKCVAYNSKNGNDQKKYLAIFDIKSEPCLMTPVRLRKVYFKETYALYDGDQMLCIGRGRKNKDLNVIVNPSERRCKNNNILEFITRIPVVLNAAGAGGSTANSVTPPVSFDEIGVQLFYFPHFANLHLSALKEIYLYGQNAAYAKSQYYLKVKEYKKWIETFVPAFELYAQFANINATAQIQDARNFYGVLNDASLDFKPMTIQI